VPAESGDLPSAPPITDAQLKKLQAMFREKGITGGDSRHLYCERVLDRKIESSRDLTLDEASQVIEHLDQYDPDNPQTWPFPDGF
jgi:hypothetical protein